MVAIGERQATEVKGKTSLAEAYWHDIQHFDPLSREQEAALAQRARQGDRRARHQLVEANLRFVVSVARSYAGRGLSMLELVAEGNLGLLEAAQRFDESRGLKFITYAVWWIRQAMLKALNAQRKDVRFPVNQINDLKKVERQIGVLTQELERSPSIVEVAESAQMGLDRAQMALEAGQPDLSLDAPAYPNDTDPLHAYFTDEDKGLEEALESKELHEALERCLTALEGRERQIIVRYFGLDDQRPMNLAEIGGVLDLTRERIRQLRDRGLEKLRAHYGELLVELSHN